MGKLLNEELKRLLGCVKKDCWVVVVSQLGFDSGVHLMGGDRYFVISSEAIDPYVMLFSEKAG